MGSLTPFLTLLSEIEDPRRAEGKLYRLPHVVLFAILALHENGGGRVSHGSGGIVPLPAE